MAVENLARKKTLAYSQLIAFLLEEAWEMGPCIPCGSVAALQGSVSSCGQRYSER